MTDHSSRQIFVAYMNIISSCNEVLCFLALTSWLPRSSWYRPLQHERYMIHCEFASWIPIDRYWFSERRNEFAPRAVTVGDCSDPGGTRTALLPTPPLSTLVFPRQFHYEQSPIFIPLSSRALTMALFHSFILPPDYVFFRRPFEGLG